MDAEQLEGESYSLEVFIWEAEACLPKLFQCFITKNFKCTKDLKVLQWSLVLDKCCPVGLCAVMLYDISVTVAAGLLWLLRIRNMASETENLSLKFFIYLILI